MVFSARCLHGERRNQAMTRLARILLVEGKPMDAEFARGPT